MQATYRRLFTAADGGSRIETLEQSLAIGFAAPPAEPLHFGQFLTPETTFWIGAPTSWKGDAAHPAPRRAIFVTTRGEYEVTTSDDKVERFSPGSVLIVEDTSGAGHATRITSSEDCYVFCVGLPARHG